MSTSIAISNEIQTAVQNNQPMVALESTVIAHGLPWPDNLHTAREMEAVIRAEGAIPATIAVWQGTPTIGLSEEQLHTLAQEQNILKASRRDLAVAVAQKRTAATTVAATMYLAHCAGLRVFATGGIGGVHRNADETGDISADLVELARTPVAVVCAGAKSILDIPRTLEFLETHGVPVLGYQTDTFPAFYLASSGIPARARVESPEEVAAVVTTHWQLDGGGVVIAQPIAEEAALNSEEYERTLKMVEDRAVKKKLRGKELTPYLLTELARETAGQTLTANRTLLLANARLAAHIAKALTSGRFAD